ncbi:MAG TPA: VOC family protein [Albitalea sp.]|nr:VOC family protein [Albitalea sp.]
MNPPTIHELFAYLCVSDAAEAIDFYQRAFGVSERFRLTEPSGRIGHAELQFGPMVLMLSDPYPEYGIAAAAREGVTGCSLHLHVDDADALGRRAVAAGAVMLSEPADQFYGERSCKVRDPFGHIWLIGHSIEDVAPDQMQRRYTALMNGEATDPNVPAAAP